MRPSQFAILTHAESTVTYPCDRDKRFSAKKETRMLGLMAPWEIEEEDLGCAYLLNDGGLDRACGAPRRDSSRRDSSPYCPAHHALCHVAYGSAAEADHLRRVEAIASVVGGRRSREDIGPSRRFLRRLERATRVVLSVSRSCFVRETYMPRPRSRRAINHTVDGTVEGGPTPERRSRGIVERAERPIADEQG